MISIMTILVDHAQPAWSKQKKAVTRGENSIYESYIKQHSSNNLQKQFSYIQYATMTLPLFII
jgi:hypothetical protein